MRKDVLYECVKTYVMKRKEDPYALFTPSLRTRKFNFSCCVSRTRALRRKQRWNESRSKPPESQEEIGRFKRAEMCQYTLKNKQKKNKQKKKGKRKKRRRI